MVDRVVFVVVLLLAGVYLWASAQIPELEMGDPLGPKAFPRFLGVGLIICAGMLFFEMRMKSLKASRVAAGQGSKPRAWGFILIMVVVIGLYFLMFERLGYVISTSLFLCLTISYFNRGKTMANVCTSLGYSGASYYLFSVLLGVNLPHGLLPF